MGLALVVGGYKTWTDSLRVDEIGGEVPTPNVVEFAQLCHNGWICIGNLFVAIGNSCLKFAYGYITLNKLFKIRLVVIEI